MAKPKLGTGQRFKALKTKLASKGAENPGARNTGQRKWQA